LLSDRQASSERIRAAASAVDAAADAADDRRAGAALPSAVSVLGQTFSVQVVAGLRDTDGEELFGLTDGDRRLIRVCSAKNDAEGLEATLLHEVIHATLYVAGLNELMDERLEEGLVRALEHGLGRLYARRVDAGWPRVRERDGEGAACQRRQAPG
jgi:hypothetical protein